MHTSSGGATVEHEHGLAHSLREKLIDLRGMDRGLRAITVLAIAVVALAGLLLAAKDLAWPRLAVTGGAHELTVALPVLIGAAVFIVIGWSCLLAGALHAHVVVRAAGMVVWTYGTSGLLLSGWSPPGLIAMGLLYLAAWATAIAMWAADRFVHDRRRSRWHHRTGLQIVTFAVFAAITAMLHLVGAVHGLADGTFGEAVYGELAIVILGATPMLYLAGTDFAEWCEVVAGRVGSAVAAVRGNLRTWIMAGLLAAAAIASLAGARAVWSLVAIAEAMIPLGLIAAVGAIAIRRGASVRIPSGRWSRRR